MESEVDLPRSKSIVTKAVLGNFPDKEKYMNPAGSKQFAPAAFLVNAKPQNSHWTILPRGLLDQEFTVRHFTARDFPRARTFPDLSRDPGDPCYLIRSLLENKFFISGLVLTFVILDLVEAFALWDRNGKFWDKAVHIETYGRSIFLSAQFLLILPEIAMGIASFKETTSALAIIGWYLLLGCMFKFALMLYAWAAGVFHRLHDIPLWFKIYVVTLHVSHLFLFIAVAIHVWYVRRKRAKAKGRSYY